MNAIYPLCAAMALEFEKMFDDSEFHSIAVMNMQWLAGLNAGLTVEANQAAVVNGMSGFECIEGRALPISMFNELGHRYAGSWTKIKGSLCNGFGTGPQFKANQWPIKKDDGPHAFHDEDWITHCGAWMCAMARYYA